MQLPATKMAWVCFLSVLRFLFAVAVAGKHDSRLRTKLSYLVRVDYAALTRSPSLQLLKTTMQATMEDTMVMAGQSATWTVTLYHSSDMMSSTSR